MGHDVLKNGEHMDPGLVAHRPGLGPSRRDGGGVKRVAVPGKQRAGLCSDTIFYILKASKEVDAWIR